MFWQDTFIWKRENYFKVFISKVTEYGSGLPLADTIHISLTLKSTGEVQINTIKDRLTLPRNLSNSSIGKLFDITRIAKP